MLTVKYFTLDFKTVYGFNECIEEMKKTTTNKIERKMSRKSDKLKSRRNPFFLYFILLCSIKIQKAKT